MSILGPAGKMSLVWLPVALDAVQCITPGVYELRVLQYCCS